MNALGSVRGQCLLKANVQDPSVREIVFVEEALPAAQSEIGEPNLQWVIRETDATAPGDAVRLAVDVESVQMGIAPAHRRLEDGMQLSHAGVAPYQQLPPDQGTDISQHDAKLVEIGHDRILTVLTCPKATPAWRLAGR